MSSPTSLDKGHKANWLLRVGETIKLRAWIDYNKCVFNHGPLDHHANDLEVHGLILTGTHYIVNMIFCEGWTHNGTMLMLTWRRCTQMTWLIQFSSIIIKYQIIQLQIDTILSPKFNFHGRIRMTRFSSILYRPMWMFPVYIIACDWTRRGWLM